MKRFATYLILSMLPCVAVAQIYPEPEKNVDCSVFIAKERRGNAQQGLEIWALITMLIYMAPFHSSSIKCFRSTKFFHFYCVLAFLSVLITYFGVNFLLGGMHSYA